MVLFYILRFNLEILIYDFIKFYFFIIFDIEIICIGKYVEIC